MKRTLKQSVKLGLIAFASILTSCSSIEEPAPVKRSLSGNNGQLRTESEIVEIANGVIGGKTRSAEIPRIDCLLRSQVQERTRSISEGNDTIAYIINYENNGGFAIIAADHRVPSVLAFSETGNFDRNMDITKDCFLSLIPSYVDRYRKETRSNVEYACFETVAANDMKTVPSIIRIKLHQKSPWNKYIKGGNPAGCVPVALASIVSHCADSLKLSEKVYHWNAIVNAIAVGPYPDIHYSAPGGGFVIGPPLVDRVMSYNDAVDSMAYFLYEIGKQEFLNVTYKSDASYAYDFDAYRLLKRLGFTLSTYYTYHAETLFSLAKSGDNIIYVSGVSPFQRHAWVIDGCKYKVITDFSDRDYSEVYYWCKWGWEEEHGKENDGYYNGDVYRPSQNTNEPFALSVIFGVKIKGRYSKK